MKIDKTFEVFLCCSPALHFIEMQDKHGCIDISLCKEDFEYISGFKINSVEWLPFVCTQYTQQNGKLGFKLDAR